MDVDGILTDGTVFISSDGSETKGFSIIDGLGLARLRDAGMELAWLSGRMSESTARRARELRIPHLEQGNTDKLALLKNLLAKLKLDPAQALYMGDDLIDAPALEYAGIGATVPEAQAEALAAADYVTTLPGGRGAVREVCNHLLAAIAKKP